MSTSEVTVLTPEQPSQPIPSSKSPRKKQKSRKSKWEVARKKIRERMNLHSAELSRRLAINRRKILKEHEGMFHDLGFEASRHLSDEQEEVLRRENDMLAKRVGTILGLEKGVHDLAARLLIQHDISIDDALTVARVQVRRDFSLMTDIENHCEIETNFNRTRTDSELSLPITLEEEIKQYARNLEVTELMDSENAIIVARREVPLAREKRFRKDSKTHSTDKLFETIFRDERYKEGTENRLSNPDEFNESHFYDKSEKNEEAITVTETDENSSSHPKMHDSPFIATGPAGSLSVNTRGGSSTEQRREEIATIENKLTQDDQLPAERNRLFSLAAKKVIEQNKANRDAFKSLGVAAAMSKTVPASFPEVDMGEDETEEGKDEVTTLKQQAQASKGRNRLFSLAAKKVIEQNKANRDAFKSLGVAAAMSKTVPTSIPQVDVGEEETEEDKGEKNSLKQQAQASAGRNRLFSLATKKVIEQNKANRDAFKSLGVAAAMSKTVPASFPKVDVGEYETEEEKVEVTTLKKQAQASAGRNSLFSQAVKKVIQQNKANRDAFKSLGVAAAMSKTVPTNFPKVDVGDDGSETKERNRLFSLAAKKVIQQNKAKRHAFKSLGATGATSKKSEIILSGEGENNRIPSGAYRRELVKSLKSIQEDSDRRTEKAKNREERESKKLAEYSQLDLKETKVVLEKSRRTEEQMRIESTFQDNIQQSEATLENATRLCKKSAKIVAENMRRCEKYEDAVRRLLDEAERIKRRNETRDEEIKQQLIIAEEDMNRLNEKRKNAYLAEWHRIKLDMALIENQFATQLKNNKTAQFNESPISSRARAAGAIFEREEDIKKGKESAERALQRLNNLEELM